jgi:plasmid rolling circle replication initiator protein Rep
MKNITKITEEIKSPVKDIKAVLVSAGMPITFEKKIIEMGKRKKSSQITAFTYEDTNLPDKEKKALRLRLCGKTIICAENLADGDPIPISAMYCRIRLCPSCSWHRAKRIFQNVYSIISDPAFSEMQFIFLTLTVKNCHGESLEGEIKRLLSAWHSLTNTKRHPFRKSFIGTFRALEVTYNRLTSTYHPHLHVMAAVEPGYFRKSNKNYISQARLRILWRDACGLDYLPQCRIEKVKGSTSKQVAEAAKYTVKSADYLNRPAVLETLDVALKSKRLIAYGGLFKSVKATLALPDDEDGLEEFPRLTAEELLRNPYIRKIILEWKLGAYDVSLMPHFA